jgi:hypothetical protein
MPKCIALALPPAAVIPQAPYRPPHTWEHIFNSNHLNYTTVGEVIRLARDAGYPYFLWNCSVWVTPAKGTLADKICDQHEIQKG